MNAHLGKPLDLDNVIATSVPRTAARSKVLKKAVFTEALIAIVQKRSGSFGRCGWLESSRVYSSNSQCDRPRGIFALRKTFFRRNTDVFQGKMTRRSVKRPAVRVHREFSDTP